MPIKLSPEEAAFLERVETYCAETLTEAQMAGREGLSLGGLRGKLMRCGYEIDKRTERSLVRVRTSEPYSTSQIEVMADQPTVEAEAMPV